MYKVLLADDEPAITQALLNNISWNEYELVVDSIVSNGVDALSYVVERDIDIAILDIQMPELSGLDLCKELHRKNSRTQIIIVSGYAEFTYAQKALTYGVLGYCLKPVEYDDLTALLLKAVNRIKKSTSIITYDDFLEALEANETKRMTAFLNERGFQNDQYYVAVTISETPLLISQEEGIVFSLGINQYGYILVSQLSNNILQTYESFSGNKGLGYFPKPAFPIQFKKILNLCIYMAYQYFISSQNMICCQYDFPPNKFLMQISNAVSFSDSVTVLSILDVIIKNDSSELFNIKTALQLCNLIISSNMYSTEGKDYYIYSFRQLVNEYTTFENMLFKLKDFISENYDVLPSQNTISNINFLKLIKYVNTNYTQDLSLNNAARIMNMNANYLSQVFKKETGINFNRYITDLRISQAKKLLKTSNASINDISIEVGFNDYFYFLKTFKKITGKTPSQFRIDN